MFLISLISANNTRNKGVGIDIFENEKKFLDPDDYVLDWDIF